MSQINPDKFFHPNITVCYLGFGKNPGIYSVDWEKHKMNCLICNKEWDFDVAEKNLISLWKFLEEHFEVNHRQEFDSA